MCEHIYATQGKPVQDEDGLISLARERIVRCGDCLSWHRGNCYKHVFTITVDGTEYDEGAFPMDASDFCSLGTRREETTTNETPND